MRRSSLVSVLLTLVTACGGSSSGDGPAATAPDGGGNPDATVPTPDAGGTPDSGPPSDGAVAPDAVAPDAGPTSDGGYQCAPHAPIPAIKYWGGPVLHTPKMVTVTFASLDAATRSQVETFDDAIVASPWWDDTMKGYCDRDGGCIGHGVSGGHVVLSDPPLTSYTDSQIPGQPRTIVDFIQGHIDDGTLPPPEADTLYTMYLPGSVTLTLDGATSCKNFGAYHFAADFKSPAVDAGDAGGTTVRAAYALMPACTTPPSAADWMEVASHELIEAATDAKSLGPTVRNADWGFYMEDPAWGILFDGQEVADLCGSYPKLTAAGTKVVRGWHHDVGPCEVPCGPLAPGDSYFGAAPDQQIVTLAVGEEAVLNVTGFSQAPRPDWLVAAVEPGDEPQFGITGYGGHLQFTWEGTPADAGADPTLTHMQNGRTLKLHVKLLSAPPQDQNFPDQSGAVYNHAFAYLSSRVDANTHFAWPFTVRQK